MSDYNAGALLGQSRPANTTAATIYTASVRTEITAIYVCNTTGTAATYRIFHDDDGTTYDQTTALFYDVSLPANTTDIISLNAKGGGLTMSKDGTIGIRTGTNDALTFSVYGITAPSR